MPQSNDVPFLNLGGNGPWLAPVVIARNRGTLGGGLRLRLGLFRGGLSGPLYISEQVNQHKTMNADTETEDQGQNTPVYNTAEARQCLHLSGKLHEARQEIKALEADLALMGEGLRYLKEARK